MFRPAAIDDGYVAGAEAFRLNSRVDRCVAAADDDNLIANFHFRLVGRLAQIFNEMQRALNAV